jgi:hypothetical protein
MLLFSKLCSKVAIKTALCIPPHCSEDSVRTEFMGIQQETAISVSQYITKETSPFTFFCQLEGGSMNSSLF